MVAVQRGRIVLRHRANLVDTGRHADLPPRRPLPQPPRPLLRAAVPLLRPGGDLLAARRRHWPSAAADPGCPALDGGGDRHLLVLPPRAALHGERVLAPRQGGQPGLPGRRSLPAPRPRADPAAHAAPRRGSPGRGARRCERCLFDRGRCGGRLPHPPSRPRVPGGAAPRLLLARRRPAHPARGPRPGARGPARRVRGAGGARGPGSPAPAPTRRGGRPGGSPPLPAARRRAAGERGDHPPRRHGCPGGCHVAATHSCRCW